MVPKLSENEVLKLIQLYREQECLWDNRRDDYRNKEKRLTALQTIRLGMSIEGFDINEIKAKIKTIRSTYYLELNKIENSTRSGAGGNVYKPRAKWFEELDAFIRNVSAKRTTTGHRYHTRLWYFHELDFLYDDDESEDNCESSILDTQRFTIDDEELITAAERPTKKPRTEEPTDLVYGPNVFEVKDEFYHWAMACASDLRKMERTQQFYSKKAFADIILEGQLGLLHRNSVKINEISPKVPEIMKEVGS